MAGLLPRILIRLAVMLVVLPAVLFLPAGTWRWWPAWVYCGLIFVAMLGALAYLYRTQPDVLERRMRMKEQESDQRRIVGLIGLVYLIGFLLPGFDHRFGWSKVPTWLILCADGLVLAGYLLIVRVLAENPWASRVVEVEQDQRVVSTGPYARVRHPMYSGGILMFLFTPLALGSYWALLPFAIVSAGMIPRIRGEERVLREQLPGYVEYCDRVRSRLVPGVW